MPDLGDIEAEYRYPQFQHLCTLDEQQFQHLSNELLSYKGVTYTVLYRGWDKMYAFYIDTNESEHEAQLVMWLVNMFEGDVPK